MKLVKAAVAAALSILVLSSCSMSGQKGDGKAFDYIDMEHMTMDYYREFLTMHQVTNTNKSGLKTEQCILRSLTREVSGAYAGMRTEWKVDMLRECSVNAALIDTGTLIVSNCTPQLITNQDELAYITAHVFAHSLLEHDNVRVSTLLTPALEKEEDPEKFNLPLFLREPGNFNAFSRALGLIDSNSVGDPYTKEQELAADNLAVVLMAKAGFNPSAALVVWQNMKKNSALRASGFTLEHPHTLFELDELSKMVQKAQPLYKSAMDEYGRKPDCVY